MLRKWPHFKYYAYFRLFCTTMAVHPPHMLPWQYTRSTSTAYAAMAVHPQYIRSMCCHGSISAVYPQYHFNYVNEYCGCTARCTATGSTNLNNWNHTADVLRALGFNIRLLAVHPQHMLPMYCGYTSEGPAVHPQHVLRAYCGRTAAILPNGRGSSH